MVKKKAAAKALGDTSDVRIGVFLPAADQSVLREIAQGRGLKLATYCRMVLVDHARGTDIAIPAKSTKGLKAVR